MSYVQRKALEGFEQVIQNERKRLRDAEAARREYERQANEARRRAEEAAASIREAKISIEKIEQVRAAFISDSIVPDDAFLTRAQLALMLNRHPDSIRRAIRAAKARSGGGEEREVGPHREKGYERGWLQEVFPTLPRSSAYKP